MKLFFRKGRWVFRKGFIPGPNCVDECCGTGGGGPGGGTCNDIPVNCLYELKTCRGVHGAKRKFVNLQRYQNNIDLTGAAPGTCFWAQCHFIPYPPGQDPIKRSIVEALIASGQAEEIISLIIDPDRSCCDCATGCQTSDLFGQVQGTRIVKCCCNCQGACVTTDWSYFTKQRQTLLSDPNNWVEYTYSGGGVARKCAGDPNPTVIPTVHKHVSTGPTFPVVISPTDEDLPFTLANFPSNGCIDFGIGGCIISCIGDHFSAACRSALGLTPFIANPPVRSCRTSTWSDIRTVEEDYEGIHYKTEIMAHSNETLSGGTADCGGGCFDTTAPVPLSDRPLWVKALSKLASKNDKGLGDTITRVVGIFGGELFKSWFKKTTGKDCGCVGRADAFNAKYPLNQ